MNCFIMKIFAISIFLISQFYSTYSIKCVECESSLSVGCTVNLTMSRKNIDRAAELGVSVTQCSGFCSKTIVRAGNYYGAVKEVRRSCSPHCIQKNQTIPGSTAIELLCCNNKDYCNSATRHINSIPVIVVTLLSIGYYLFNNIY
ncbi:hypothetical protein SNEBB_006899 [Seison nebaliae]|nr:hypothetical protein SNEBB_006899 [Seison nebaliae]